MRIAAASTSFDMLEDATDGPEVSEDTPFGLSRCRTKKKMERYRGKLKNIATRIQTKCIGTLAVLWNGLIQQKTSSDPPKEF